MFLQAQFSLSIEAKLYFNQNNCDSKCFLIWRWILAKYNSTSEKKLYGKIFMWYSVAMSVLNILMRNKLNDDSSRHDICNGYVCIWLKYCLLNAATHNTHTQDIIRLFFMWLTTLSSRNQNLEQIFPLTSWEAFWLKDSFQGKCFQTSLFHVSVAQKEVLGKTGADRICYNVCVWMAMWKDSYSFQRPQKHELPSEGIHW